MDEFNGFEDFISSFHIYRGRAKSRDEEQDTIVGEFKVGEVFCFKLTIVFRLDFQPFWECGYHPPTTRNGAGKYETHGTRRKGRKRI